MAIKTPIPVKMHKRRKQIVERLLEIEEDVVFADGFDAAIIGLGMQHTKKPVVVYDRNKCIEILMRRDHMSHEDAEEFFCFNTECAWVGDQTPMFLDRCEG
jgi:hypothetical protein